MENSNLQKADIHRRHNPIHIKPPPTTQIRGSQIHVQ
jgi:hypothetical protein